MPDYDGMLGVFTLALTLSLLGLTFLFDHWR